MPDLDAVFGARRVARAAAGAWSSGNRYAASRDDESDPVWAMVDAFAGLPRDRFVPLADFVRHGARVANPLLKQAAASDFAECEPRWSGRMPTDEEMEETWGLALTDVFRHRLLPMGCVRVGITGAENDLCFTLTDVGRYVFGLADDFTYDETGDPKGQVVVQPNFDVVFLAVNPLAEAAIGRFAERRGRGTGTLFGITHQSILKAAGSGSTAEQVLGTLQRLSSKAIPPNVEHEIRNWFGQCRRITLRSSILIRCPDAETAARVRAAGGRKIVPVADTVLELTDVRFKSTLINKLRHDGVFLTGATSSGGVKTPG